MIGPILPAGYRLERLAKSHPRKRFCSGEPSVDDWLHTKSLQQQSKRLSSSTVLLDPMGEIAGYYTLATGQVDFGDLPIDITKRLPKRVLPVAVLAWLGVSQVHQGHGLGKLLLTQAICDCHEASHTLPFVAVVLDCVSPAAKVFYERFGFQQMPGDPFRMYISADRLAAILA